MFITTLLWNQLFVTPTYPTDSFANKTVIVTGSNTGLGLEAARHFVRLGAALVILAVRTESKGLAAKDSILATSERDDKPKIEVWPLDLQSSESVQAFAARVQGLLRVDALVENAGVTSFDFSLVEGTESTIKTNVVSTLLLALLLLPKMRETALKFNTLPHLSLVTSELYEVAKFAERKSNHILDALNEPQKADMMDRYNVSKLLQVLFVRELVDHINTSSESRPPVVINLVGPGFCHSELRRSLPTWMRPMIYVMEIVLARKTEVGSRTLVHGAVAGEESHGQYLSNCSVTPIGDWVKSDEGTKAQKQVYRELMAKLEEISPGISENI